MVWADKANFIDFEDIVWRSYNNYHVLALVISLDRVPWCLYVVRLGVVIPREISGYVRYAFYYFIYYFVCFLDFAIWKF